MPPSGQLEKHGENKRKQKKTYFYLFFHVFTCFFFVRTSRAIKKLKPNYISALFDCPKVHSQYLVSYESVLSQYFDYTLTVPISIQYLTNTIQKHFERKIIHEQTTPFTFFS